MASYRQNEYCRNCKRNVSVDDAGNCKRCGEKTEKGTWVVRFRYVEGGKTVDKRLSGFDKKNTAKKAYMQYVSRRGDEKANVENDVLTFDNVYQDYIRHVSCRLKESSICNLQSSYAKHMYPYFGKKDIREITKMDILAWQNSLTQKGLAFSHKAKIRTYLHTFYQYAFRYYDVENIVRLVEPFRRVETDKKKEMAIWSNEEFFRFIAQVHTDIYRMFFVLLYYTGMRKGEAQALTWNDIDFDKRSITINKSVTRKTFDKSYKITTTKNVSSNREIAIPQVLYASLKEYYKKHRADKFVFGGSRPLPNQTIANNLQSACRRANVKNIRVHDFRHTHASLLISLGLDIVTIAKRLGHSDIEQTLNTYGHLMPNSEQRIISALDGLTGGEYL